MIWGDLDTGNKLWLINNKGELIGTIIYKKELGSYAGKEAYVYTFNIEDEYGYNAYQLVLYTDGEYEDVLLKKLMLANVKRITKEEYCNTNLFMLSYNKLALLQCYHKHICESIEEVSNVVEEGIKNLTELRNRAATYLQLIKEEEQNA